MPCVMIRRLRQFRPDARAWLVAAACVGIGQQIFVVLRNQYLYALGASGKILGAVQGAGAAAGVVSGLLGLWALRRLSARTVLGAAVLANGVGFAIQALAVDERTVLFGSAVAGLGIQGLTMASGPFLVRASSPEERLRLFGWHAIVLTTLPGAIGALLGGVVHRWILASIGSVVEAYRVVLGMGAVAVLAGLLPLSSIRERLSPETKSVVFRLRRPGLAAALLVPDAMVFFGTGLMVPFLQVHFQATFGLAPEWIGGLYAVTMVLGTVAHAMAPSMAGRFGTWQTVLAAQIVAVPMYATVGLAGSVVPASIAFVLRQTTMNVALVLYTSLLHETVPPEDSGPVASYRMLVQAFVWSVANVLGGWLLALDEGRFRLVTVVTVVVYIVGICVGAVVFPRAVGSIGRSEGCS